MLSLGNFEAFWSGLFQVKGTALFCCFLKIYKMFRKPLGKKTSFFGEVFQDFSVGSGGIPGNKRAFLAGTAGFRGDLQIVRNLSGWISAHLHIPCIML